MTGFTFTLKGLEKPSAQLPLEQIFYGVRCNRPTPGNAQGGEVVRGSVAHGLCKVGPFRPSSGTLIQTETPLADSRLFLLPLEKVKEIFTLGSSFCF